MLARVSRGLTARGVAVVGALALLAAVLALNAGVAVAAEACPNEQLRQESNIAPGTAQPYSALLPECRAYEMVSPLYKQSHDVGVHGAFFVPTELAVAPNGEALFWQSQGNFGEPENYFLKAGPDEPYLSRRGAGASGWETSSAFAPAALIAEPVTYGPFVDFSPDLTSQSVSCGENNLVGHVEEPRQAFACAVKHQALPWERTPLYTSFDNAILLGNSALAYRGGSSDLSRVFLQVSVPLLPEDVKAAELSWQYSRIQHRRDLRSQPRRPGRAAAVRQRRPRRGKTASVDGSEPPRTCRSTSWERHTA